ncbi:MAG: 23S rRNA (guanosine(2251)-2'-O)-methyltransferase RlmB [Bdellovibrionaceae bacterium]|nr:23S rRNA (guanosine(2251)-2'-O)-methyltransferase RlmB [Bdellovibrio sp.]
MKKATFQPKRKPTKYFGNSPKPSGSAKPQKKDLRNFAMTPEKKSDKPAFPRSWRQVAGIHAIAELLSQHPKSVKTVLLQSNWKTSAELRELVADLEKKKITIEEKSESQLHEICRSHQGAVAFSDLNILFEFNKRTWGENGLVLALDGVEDTHNLGAILRTSWLMGVNGVIIPEDRAVGLTAAVHKVACGGVEHVPILRTNQFAPAFEDLKKAGFWVFGLSHKAERSIYDLKIPEKVIWVLGAEDKGLRGTTEKVCDELVSIPQASPTASYNVSVSAALALAETKRQWAAKPKAAAK